MDPNAPAPPALKARTSAERARSAKPIFRSTDDDDDDVVTVLIRCGKSRLTVKFPDRTCVSNIADFILERLSPAGPFSFKMRKGGKKFVASHDGINLTTERLAGESLKSLGLAPRAMIQISSDTGADLSLKGARSQKAIATSAPRTQTTTTNGELRHPSSLSELQKIIRDAGQTPVIIDFFADWCGPCKMIAPAFKSMAATNRNGIFVKVNETMRDAMTAFGVTAFPTFQFFRGGQKIDEMRGADENGLRRRVRALCGGHGGGATIQSNSTSHGSSGGGSPFGFSSGRPRPSPNPRPSSGTHRRSPGGMGMPFGAPGPRPPPPASRPSTSSSGGGRRMHTFGSLRGNGARRVDTSKGKNVFSATDLGFGGRGG